MCEIVRPLKRVTVSCLRTSISTPFYLSIASSSVQSKPPWGGSTKPFKIDFLSRGMLKERRSSSNV